MAEDEAGLPGPRIGEPVVTDRPSPFLALRHREFRLLFGAFAVGDIGFWVSHISLQSEMADVTDGSSMWLGVLFFTTFIPLLLFAPVAGVVADRVDRKRMLVVTRGTLGVLAAALSAVVLGGLGKPGALLLFGFGIGTIFAFMAPAQQAATANAVPAHVLTSAITLQSAGNNIARIGGPALAAPILAFWGAGWGFALYAASNVVMVAMLVPVHLTSQLDTQDDLGSWERWREGLRHARERPPAMATLKTMAVFSVFGAAVSALYPVFASDVLGRSRRDFTFLVVASGIGAVIGALGVGFRRAAPSLRIAAVWLAASAVASFAFAMSRSWPLSLALNLLFGLCYFSLTTTLNSLLQHLADDDKRGRIMSLFVLTWGGLVPFGGIWMGIVANVAGAPLAVGIGAAVCLIYSIRVLTRTPVDYPANAS